MKITVAICTWNRKKLLDQTLDRMQELIIPKNIKWEILVVNNNCTDDSDHIIKKHSDRLPIRRVFEGNPGLSNARNAAVKEASGDYILWTDDDVLVDEYWIEAYVRAFQFWPEATIFGGPINPWFEKKPPNWLEEIWDRISFAYAVRDLGPEPIPITKETFPFGANYAINLVTQRQYSYDPELGRKGKGMLGGEEELLIAAMLQDGLKGVWVPDAKVSHFIPCSRQKISYLRSYFRGQGLFFSRGASEPYKSATFFGYPCRLIKAAMRAEVKYHFRKSFCSPGLWIGNLIESSKLWGKLEAYSSKASKLTGQQK